MGSYRTGSRNLLAVLLLTFAFGAWGKDAAPPPRPEAAAPERQAAAFVEAMKPRRPGAPVVVVLARNEGTETTDFLLPHAVLKRAGVADVRAVAARPGTVKLYPALQVEVAEDLAAFDKAQPSGADYVIVPAMDDADDPAIGAWLRQQAGKGARIIGVCAGALVLGRAGLLDGRRFVTHWYYKDKVLERHRGAVHVPNQRYVVDGAIATTTGITASVPTMLALVEAIGGRERAQALAAELGVASWTPAHDSFAFGLDARRMAGYLLAKAAFWRRERWRVDVAEGMDDVALALAVDAWTRTGYIGVDAAGASGVRLRSGMVLAAAPGSPRAPRLPLTHGLRAAEQLDRTLCEIGQRFGAGRRAWVKMELEYAGAPACPAQSPR